MQPHDTDNARPVYRRLTHLLRRASDLLLPPICLRLLTCARNRWGPPDPLCSRFEFLPGGPSQWRPVKDEPWNAQAVLEMERERWAALCRNLEGAGPLGFSHEDHDMKVVDSPFFHNLHMTFSYVLALAAHGKTELSVLDYGGSLGHYYQVGRAVLPEVKLEYHVKEVPRIVALGRELNPEVHWHEDDRCLEQTYDLVLVSSSLQYVQDWKRCLQQLARASRAYFLLTRIPAINRHPSYVVIQRVYSLEMFMWILNRDEILQVVEGSGARRIRELVLGDPVPIRHGPENATLQGWLFKRDPSPTIQS